jgi:RimJ/RimL family protein N-acetyltransferase
VSVVAARTPETSTRPAPELRGERVLLRGWRDGDLEPFAALNADPRVMQHFPAPLSREQSDAFVYGRIDTHLAEHGYGLWAVELPGSAPFIGYVGLLEQTFEAPFTPCTEVGWRLAFRYWGSGYATEGAQLALDYGFAEAGLDEIVSLTAVENVRSIAVMERLGMTKECEFEHPSIPEGHRLRRHVLYRLTSQRWQAGSRP